MMCMTVHPPGPGLGAGGGSSCTVAPLQHPGLPAFHWQCDGGLLLSIWLTRGTHCAAALLRFGGL